MGSCLIDTPISFVNSLGLLPFIIFDAKGMQELTMDKLRQRKHHSIKWEANAWVGFGGNFCSNAE